MYFSLFLPHLNLITGNSIYTMGSSSFAVGATLFGLILCVPQVARNAFN